MLHPKREEPQGPRESEVERTFYRSVTPLWDAESGRRLGYVRMDRLWSQKDLAQLLGVSHGVISRIEQGKLRVSSFSLHEMRAVFGYLELEFIIKGKGGGKYDEKKIWKKFWDTAHTEQTKNAVAANKRKTAARDKALGDL